MKRGRAYYLRKNYGLTTRQWDLMFERCKGICAICLKPLYRPGNPEGKRAAQVDHDHGPSKRVRGLLCMNCNKYKVSNNKLEHAKRMVKYLSSKFDGRNL